MPRYQVEASYDMGTERGRRRVEFVADDDEAAKHQVEHRGEELLNHSGHNPQVRKETLTRLIEW